MKRFLSKTMVDRRTALAAFAAAGVSLAGGTPMTPATGPQSNDPLQKFSAGSREKLHRLSRRANFGGKIEAADVRALARAERKSVEALMSELLPLAQTYSRPPVSNYRVGAVVHGASGSLYLGANFEVPGQALGFSVHAEQAALSSAYMHSERFASSIAVSAAPCGHCRQFMNELAPDGSIQVLVAGQAPTSLSRLLPLAFGPKELGLERGAFPPAEVEIKIAQASGDDLRAAALAAARKSWAPYTKAHSGVAVGTRDGRVAAGSYIENAAFNPSLPPLETALIAVVLSGGNPAEISRAVLVEPKGALISQRRITETVLEAVAPDARLETVLATVA